MNFDLEAARAILCDHQESIEEGVVPSFTMAELMRLINHLSAALDEIERLRTDYHHMLGADPTNWPSVLRARAEKAEAEVERLRETAIRQAGMPPTIVGEQVFRDRYIDVKAERDEYAAAARQLAGVVKQHNTYSCGGRALCFACAALALPVVRKLREET